MKKILSCLKGYLIPTILCPLFVICEVIIEVSLPSVMAEIVDKAIPNGDLNLVIKLGGSMVIFAMVSLIFGGLAGWVCSIAGAGFARNLRRRQFVTIQNFSFANIDKFSTGSLVTRMTTDVGFVQMAFQQLIRGMVRSPIMFVVSLISAYGISPKMTSIFLIVAPILAIGLAAISLNAFPNFKRMFKQYDVINTTIQENATGIRVVKTFVREDHEIDKFKEQSSKLKLYASRAEKILAFNGPLMQVAMYTTMILIFLIGGMQVINGSYVDGVNPENGEMLFGYLNLSPAQLSTLFTYSIMLLNSLMMISMSFVMVVMSKESFSRIIEVLKEESDIQDGPNKDLEVKDGSIIFKDVTFSYYKDENNLALETVNLKIESGETIGIIGGTGSSKTTLVQLIPRFYDVTSGELLVGGENVKDYTLNNLRNAVSMVLQKNVLFSGTIKDNLRWGDEFATDEEIIEACKNACAHDFIMSFPNQYETDLGQGGVNVSGGQKQRLCIARALLKKPKILILDDSTSAVDTKTDAIIRKSLRENLSDVTKLIIAQRVSSVQDADKIIVLDEGRIVGFGTHEELLETNEIYKDVYMSQMKGADENE